MGGLEIAVNALEPAKIGVGRAKIDIGHNRRFIKDGVCYMRRRNEERVPTSPIDPEAGIIRFDSATNGKPIVTLVLFACHPVIFASDNKRYSADWPGEMCKLVREETGGECIFLQGGAGDINPYLDKTPVSEGADANVIGEGRKAGKAVLAASDAASPLVRATADHRLAQLAVYLGSELRRAIRRRRQPNSPLPRKSRRLRFPSAAQYAPRLAHRRNGRFLLGRKSPN